MDETIIKDIIRIARKWLKKEAAKIDSKQVIKDISVEVETGMGYFFILTIANLIALSGLIINSIPVIIGAMLISPLMGPILSVGFAFVTGDKFVWEKAAKKIAFSVILIIAVAAVATYLSPLKSITHQIISRIKPNLYDLAIAFFSGLAGAAAICTKKNYMTIVPGVAIATAVIPPLSVAGFGLGIADFKIFAGGFFLFFTNFVAIIIATVIVFFFYGFKPSLISEADVSSLKKRAAALTVVLVIISIPLIYTLQKSIAEVTLRNNIHGVLQKAFNNSRKSNLVNFNYIKGKNGVLLINAVVDTVTYLTKSETNEAEKNIKYTLNKNVKLYIEQIKVLPGGLEEEGAKHTILSIVPLKSQSDIIKNSREHALSVIKRISQNIDKIISPSKILNYSIGFNNKTQGIYVIMTVEKDRQFTKEEVSWIKRTISLKLNLPVSIKVYTTPFVQPLIFKTGETALSETMKKSLVSIRQAYDRDKNIRILINAYTGSTFYSKERLKLAGKRISAVIVVLNKKYKIPMTKIKTAVYKSKKSEAPYINITVH